MRSFAFTTLRASKEVRILLTAPLALSFAYLLWQWVSFLNAHIFSDDRFFHTQSLIHGLHKPSEPLWGLIAPAIGNLVPGYEFETAGVITIGLIAIGALLNRFSRFGLAIVALSPGVAYLTTNALRQGLAMGLFLVLIGLTRKRDQNSAAPYKIWLVLLWLVPVALIHNAMVIAGAYLIASRVVSKYVRDGRNSQIWQVLLCFASAAMIPVGSAVGQVGATAVGILGMQLVLLALSLVHKVFRSPAIPLVAMYLMVAAAGFIFTSTGVRVLIMVSLFAPLVIPKWGNYLALSGCALYPLFVIYVLGMESGDWATML
jgi:hypothetical protein